MKPLHAALTLASLLTPLTARADEPPVAPPPEGPPVAALGAAPPVVASPDTPPLAARADTPYDEPSQAKGTKGERWDAWAWLRARGTTLSGFPLDTAGTRSDQRRFLETRVRVGGAVRALSFLDLHVELDALSGIAAGDRTSLGAGPGEETLRYRLDERFGLAKLELRQAYATILLPFGQLRAGRMAFTWGTGMVANGGSGEPDFGDRRYGDLVHRVTFGTKPLSGLAGTPEAVRGLALFVGGDLVHRDENADWSKGDRARALVFGIRTETKDLTIGVFQSFRWQRDREEPSHPERGNTRVDAAATDLYARAVVLRPWPATSLALEGEAVLVRGTTDRPYLDENKDGAKVRSFGGIARVTWEDDDLRLRARAEVGYASGDNDPHDATVRTFSFDPDYKVGLVLFDQVLARLSARGVDRITSPGLLAVPPSGARYLETQGAVSNAIYVNPTVRFRPLDTGDHALDLRLGWLFARSAADIVDPYSSAKVGGYDATYGERSPGSRALGHELDASAKYTVRLPGDVKLRGGAEAGVLFAGAAFAGLNMSRPWTGRLVADVVW